MKAPKETKDLETSPKSGQKSKQEQEWYEEKAHIKPALENVKKIKVLVVYP